MKKSGSRPEYTLDVYPRYDEATRERTTVFLVQTTRIFVSFRYEILLTSEVKPGEIHLDILGLHAPSILMPESGPARGIREFAGLSGSYILAVRKQDKSINEFEMRFGKERIDVLRKPAKPFIDVSTHSDGVNPMAG
ncbi:MAG TPA: hypothetical protein VMM57_09870 [Bacteroidota bacterium]|nr:hypothetical protein [Bacteroidota bacterium]